MENTQKGSIIRITALENVLYTEITITDNGPGIQKEDLPHLFERFYKGKNSSDQGFGIGLALARTIIVSQSGTIKAENAPEGGQDSQYDFINNLQKPAHCYAMLIRRRTCAI